MSVYILGIESSCDDTSAAVLDGTRLLSNITAGQEVHRAYGGVVPELASRAHQQHIVPVIDTALKEAKIHKNQLHIIAYTRGPGLLGSLLVGSSFAKAFALANNCVLIDVDHMEAHVLAHFIQNSDAPKKVPQFPFLCLTVSGGHTQIVKVNHYFDMEIIGKTIDDAAGEAFDKAAKIMGLAYPGGPVIDRLAQTANPNAYQFPEPKIEGLDFSFSGLKTSFLYFIRDRLKENPDFIQNHMNDLAASIQHSIVNILTNKLKKASQTTGIKQIAIAGGVSANSSLRNRLNELAQTEQWELYIPPFEFTTDNAAMIAVTGYLKYIHEQPSSPYATPYARQEARYDHTNDR